MSIALSEFWTRLVQSGIADAEACKQFAKEYSLANQGTPADDSAKLARFLVDAKHLTSFQSRALLANPPQPIRLGGFVQTSDKPSMPLGHWLPVRTVRGQDQNVRPGWGGRRGFLLRVPAAQTTESVSQWLAAHAAVAHDSLQPIELYGAAGGDREVFTPLAKGRSLCELTADKMKVSRRQALGLSISVANALSALHGRSLIHGEVRADRIWMSAGGITQLLRDPSGPPRVPRADPATSWLHSLESAGGYAAPEFANPHQTCTIATDIYSLGCLMFRMFVGRMPMADASGGVVSNLETAINAHASHVPSELNQAIQQGESGDPVLRVIAYAMAKSPASRFASAQQVADALTAIEASLSSKPKSAAPIPAQAPVAPAKKNAPKPAPPPVKPLAESKPAVPPVLPDDPPPAAGQESAIAQKPPPKSKPESATKSVERATKKTKASTTPPPAAKTAAPPVEKKTVKNASPPAPAQRPTPPEPTASSESTAPPETAPPKPTAPSEISPPEPPAPVSVSPLHLDSDPVAPPLVQPASPTKELVAAEASNTEISAPTESDSTTPADSLPRRRRRKKKNNLPLILGMLSIPVLATFVMLVARGSLQSNSSPTKKRPPIPAVVPPVASSTRIVKSKETAAPPDQAATVAGYQIVSQGQFPWVAPYEANSPPPSLELLPPGPAAVISVRLKSLLGNPAGAEWVAAMSPELNGLIKQAADRARMEIESIQRLTIALHADRDGWPQVSLAFVLDAPRSAKDLTDLWQVSAARTPEGATIYAGDEPDSDAFYFGNSQKGALSPDSMVTRFAVGTVDRIKDVASNEGGAIPLTRAMQKLWDSSSQESHLVAIVTPNFLFADGRQMLARVAPEMVSPLKRFLISDVAGLQVSATAVTQRDATASSDVVYTELKAIPSGGISSAALMRKLQSQISTWPEWADRFSIDAVPDRSWRLLANRLPQMMRFFVEHTRLGVHDDIVIANNYVPAPAAAQISLATLLAMNTPLGQVTAAAPTPAKPLSVDEMLDRKMSVAFDQESLEFAIDAIVDEFKRSLPPGSTMPEVRIIGSDLEKNGITQNQQIRDFTKKDVPLRTVLTDLLRGANPDKTATGPADPKQALVWVVHQESGKPVLLVTTRTAADGKYELPNEFKPQ